MAERDPNIYLGQFTERAEDYVARGVFESIDEVIASALDALDRQEDALTVILREKVAEALADPRPAIPMEEAFRRLDEAKARRRA